jgi:hypothetical protein
VDGFQKAVDLSIPIKSRKGQSFGAKEAFFYGLALVCVIFGLVRNLAMVYIGTAARG